MGNAFWTMLALLEHHFEEIVKNAWGKRGKSRELLGKLPMRSSLHFSVKPDWNRGF